MECIPVLGLGPLAAGLRADVALYCESARRGEEPGPVAACVLVQGPTGELSKYTVRSAWATELEIELEALAFALATLPAGATVTLQSTDQALIDGLRDWAWGWEAHDWKTPTGKPVANAELWARVLPLSKALQLRPFVIKAGHGVPPPLALQAYDLAKSMLTAVADDGEGLTLSELLDHLVQQVQAENDAVDLPVYLSTEEQASPETGTWALRIQRVSLGVGADAGKLLLWLS